MTYVTEVSTEETGPPRQRFDLIAYDAENRPILLVQAKRGGDSRSVERVAEELEQYLDTIFRYVPPFIIATPTELRLYKRSVGGTWSTAHVFDTKEVLRAYHAHFGDHAVSTDTMLTLIDLWLSDVTLHWKSTTPPGASDLDRLNLTAPLRTGRTEVRAFL